MDTAKEINALFKTSAAARALMQDQMSNMKEPCADKQEFLIEKAKYQLRLDASLDYRPLGYYAEDYK